MKKKILFAIYCFIAISALVVALILFANRPKEDKDKPQTKIYATNVFLSCPREITVEVGSTTKLLDGYLTIEPSNTTETLEISVSSKVDNADGITFENNTIFAHEIGFYYIKFSVASSENKYLYDTLVVNIKEDAEQIIPKITSVYVNETYHICDLFDIHSSLTISSAIVNNATISNNNITFNTIGNVSLNLVLNMGYVNYLYGFNILVKEISPPTDYNITITNYSEDNINLEYIENENHVIVYRIQSAKEQNVSQTVKVTLSNLEVVNFVGTNNNWTIIETGWIVLQSISRGTVQITITYEIDTSIQKTLTININ